MWRCGGLICGQAEELEWGADGYEVQVRRLASHKPELILAADCCYIDQDGTSPSTPHFIQACKGGLSWVGLGWGSHMQQRCTLAIKH